MYHKHICTDLWHSSSSLILPAAREQPFRYYLCYETSVQLKTICKLFQRKACSSFYCDKDTLKELTVAIQCEFDVIVKAALSYSYL